MKHENEAVIRFPSLSRNEAFARSVTAAFAAQMDPTVDELNDVKTAVSEAVTNAIVHAYPDELGRIGLRASGRQHPGGHGQGPGLRDRGRRPGSPADVHHRRGRPLRHGTDHHGELYECPVHPLPAWPRDHGADEEKARRQGRP